MTDSDWKVIESRELLKNFYTAGYDEVRQPNGSTKKYYWIDLPEAVMVVATVDEKLIMVEQYHPATRRSFLECPAGLVEEGESYIEAGVRELKEETGYESDHESCEVIESLYVMPGVMKVKLGIIYAGDTQRGETDRGRNEFLEVKKVSFEDALREVRSPPVNGLTLQSLLLAKHDGLI